MKYNHKYEATKGLQPEPFFYWFGEVSACPRPSGNEKALIDYIKNYCEERNLPCDIDEAGNVFVKVPGTAGYEDYPAFLIQGHMDIVPVKDEGVDFDFDKDPYNLQIDGDKIYAPGTTLGADNGVGIATMLAFADTLAEEPVPHPPLELLFTVEEETGMKGIKRFDCSKITARKMINCDSGDPHRVAVCCGGNSKSKIEKEFETEPVGEGWTVLEISLTGGQGGHSGGMINKGRACAANNMGELLTALMADEKVSEFRICSLKTSTPSIIKTCDAIIAVPTADAKAAEDCMNDRFALIKGIYKNSDPDLALAITEAGCGAESTAISAEVSGKVAQCLLYLETAMYRSHYEFTQSPVTGGSIYFAELTADGQFSVDFSVRSSINEDLRLKFKKYVLQMKMLGLDLVEYDSWLGWVEEPVSPLRDALLDAHSELFGYDMAIGRGIGGIEVGAIKTAIPEMDAVAFAPFSKGAHTTSEYLSVSQVQPFWDLLKKLVLIK